MDDDLWEVALPSGEVKRMSLDQLDRAFQIGLIHSNTLIREGDGGEWQTLGAVAGLDDEPATEEAPTARAEDPPSEPQRISVLPAPPEDGDPNRETLAGLGGFRHVAPKAGAATGAAPKGGAGQAAPPLGSRPPAPKAVPPRAATLPMGVPSPVVVSRTPSSPPQPRARGAALAGPALPESAFGPVAKVTPPTSRPPPLPPNAFGPRQPGVAAIPTVSLEPARGRGAAQPALAQPQPVQPQPLPAQPQPALAQPDAETGVRITEVRAVRPAAPESPPGPPALGSAPPPPKVSAPPPPKVSAPPPLPADAFPTAAGGSHAPAAGPAVMQPFAAQPVAAQPVAAQPVAAQAFAAQPVAAQPVAAQPFAAPQGAAPVSQPPVSGVGMSPQAVAAGFPAPPPQASPAPQFSPARKSGRSATIVLTLFAATTLLIALHRNGVLFQVATSLGLAGTYTKLEADLIGPPSLMTPRGVERLLASDASPATASPATAAQAGPGAETAK